MKNKSLLILIIFEFSIGLSTRVYAEDSLFIVRNLNNFSSFGPGLFRGARPNGQGFVDLQRLGVKTVIDLQGGDITDPVFGVVAGWLQPGESAQWLRFEKNVIEGLGMRFINAPLNSLDAFNRTEGRALGRALKLMSDPKNRPVYIHCEHGADRTGLAVALYRVYFQGWPKQKAHDEMIEHGHGFINQLMTSDMDDFFWAVTDDQK